MKMFPAAVLALSAAAPALAAAPFTLDFEGVTGFTSILDYYNGGTDGAGNSGINVGASFTGGAQGLVNDELGPYFANAPTPVGVMFAADPDAMLNVAAGVTALRFAYSTPTAVVGAVKAYSGLNGTGALLGTLNLTVTDPAYSQWKVGTLNLSGVARSFDFGASTGSAAFDNISAVPEPSSIALTLAGIALIGVVAARRRG
jgi:hypothetical protein